MTVVLLTGASSGIGWISTVYLASRGYRVYAVARRLEKLEPLKRYGIRPLFMDLCDENSIQTAVDTIVQEEGKIDILINNAGYGVYGAIEDVDLKTVKEQFEVNLFAQAKLTQLVLPYMREQRKGKIINISSIAGKMTLPLGAWYHASKHALEAYSDALRMEVKPFGIDVIIIEPGAIKTPWGLIVGENLKSLAQDSIYKEMTEKQAKFLLKHYTKNPFFPPPKCVAECIYQAMVADKPKTRYLVGFGARTIMMIKRLLPDKVFDIIVKQVMKW